MDVEALNQNICIGDVDLQCKAIQNNGVQNASVDAPCKHSIISNFRFAHTTTIP